MQRSMCSQLLGTQQHLTKGLLLLEAQQLNLIIQKLVGLCRQSKLFVSCNGGAQQG